VVKHAFVELRTLDRMLGFTLWLTARLLWLIGEDEVDSFG
jgi:hypothetical protein